MVESKIYPAGSGEIFKGTKTFTGDVNIEMIQIDSKCTMAIVTFTPCARTHWHTHEEGQILKVLTGSGLICDAGGKPKRISVGDVIWSPPGTTHWHGADTSSNMTHLAMGLGKCNWHDVVTDDDYNLESVAQNLS